MIVLCGIPSEPPVRMVAAAAERRGIEAVMLNQRESGRTAFEIGIARESRTLRYHGPAGSRSLDSAKGIFVRLMDYRRLPEYAVRSSTALRDRNRMEAWHSLLADWLEASDCVVMNRLRPSNSNMSKPYQAQLIAKAGFRSPQTLVTNQPEEVKAFQRNHGRIIFKSISAHRSIVQELTKVMEARLDRTRALPTQFQELVEGDDIRVHVVGSKIFATRIRSTVIDYRYAADEGGSAVYEATELPTDVTEKCGLLSSSLGLPFCGIDLKRSAEGDYVCLEVNPSPAFSGFEEQTGQPIADAIVEALAEA